jgi:hypothetical protein
LSLQHHRSQLLRLRSRWTSPLASALRFESQEKEAVSLAESLSGTSPSISLSWVSPVVLEAPSHFPEEEDAWPLESGAAEAEEVDVVEQALDRNVVLEDYFAEDPAISHEDVEDMDPQTPSFSPLIPIIWELPQVRIRAVILASNSQITESHPRSYPTFTRHQTHHTLGIEPSTRWIPVCRFQIQRHRNAQVTDRLYQRHMHQRMYPYITLENQLLFRRPSRYFLDIRPSFLPPIAN